MEITPILTRRDETIRAEKNPHTTAPVVGTVRKDSGKGIMQLHETIRRGHLKLRKLDEDWVWLRKKSMTLGEVISKLETDVAQACCAEKLSMMGQGLANHTTTLEEVVTLLPWLQLHLTRQSKQGSVPYKEECDTLQDARVIEGCPWPGLAGKLKPQTGGATT